jgi:hypothetical protein
MKRRFNSLEVGTLSLAMLLFSFGLISIVHPVAAAWAHPATDSITAGPRNYIEVITKDGARFYGVLGVLFGGGLAMWVILPWRKR